MLPKPCRGGRGRTFLFLFLLPVVGAAALGSLVILWSLQTLLAENRVRYAEAQQDFRILAEIAHLGEQLAATQQQVTTALKEASAGRLDEAGVYRVHVQMVDSLAELGKRSVALARDPHVFESSAADAEIMVKDFENYQNFMVMATDIVAIDPARAADYIDMAQEYFTDFVKRRHIIAGKLTEYAVAHNDEGAKAFADVFGRVLVISGLGLAVMLLLAMVSGRLLSVRLDAVAAALHVLAKQRGLPPALPGMERLARSRIGELRDMATAVLAFHRTIEERHLAETDLARHRDHLEELVQARTAELRASEERLKQAQEIAHLGNWEWNLADNSLLWSDETYRIFGWEGREVCPDYQCFLEAVHPDDRELVETAVDHALRTREAEYAVEYRLVRPDGSERVVQERGRVIRDEPGAPLRMVGIVLDITERVKAREDLELYRVMIEKTADPVFLIDIEDDFRMAYVNEAAVHHYGAPREEILSWRIPDWDPNFKIGDLDAHLAEMRAHPGLVIETLHRVKGGELVPVEVSLNLTRYKGRLCHFGYIKNISQRKETERKLREAKEQAEAAARLKAEFLANMSHEIRTPMNAVINLTRLALAGDLQGKPRDYLEKVLRAGKQLLHLINDILDFSKIEAGKLTIEQGAFSLEELVSDVANVISPQVQAKPVEFLIDLPSSLPAGLIGDSLRLGQVLNNLVNNAVKFTEKGEVVLAVKELGRRPQGVILEFSVRDSGIGMSDEQQAQLFTPFQQGDGSITRRFGGTGLGLAISRQLLRLMGSDLHVESAPGQGSVFSFTLDFGVSGAAARKAFLPAEVRQKRVLVVDDNLLAREIVGKILHSVGMEVDMAAGGREALRLAADGVARGVPYGLVFTDWKMPDLDGFEMADRIRAITELSETPDLILVTGYATEEAKEKARAAGFAAVMEKPVSPSELVDFLAGHGDLRRHRPEAEVAAALLAEVGKRRGARVLLVEDNDINQEIAVALLEGVGLEVAVAANGVEAVDLLAHEGFELVLMDLQMPEMDGYEATRQIRLREEWRDLPIVAMTAHAMTHDRQRCLDAGMNDHVAKPIEVAELYAALVRWLPAREQRQVLLPLPERPGEAELPAQLPGINMARGLLRLGGNRDLYLKLLARFGESNVGVETEIVDALEQGRRAEARARVHALKGVAGNLGAETLLAAAEELESSLADPEAEAAAPLARFTALLDQVLAGLRPLAVERQQAAAAPAAARAVEGEAVAARLRALAPLLESDLGEARCRFEELRLLLAQTALQAEGERLGRALDEYDTDGALAVIEGLVAQLDQER
ncbi:MAG: response regulator [Desulfobulbaceae bacterium]|nr:response regulator [Desulfobulbaceae bacterium]